MTKEQSPAYIPSSVSAKVIRTGYIAILMIYSLFTLLSFLFINQISRMHEEELMTEERIRSDIEKINYSSAMMGLYIRSYLLTGEKSFLEERSKQSQVYMCSCQT